MPHAFISYVRENRETIARLKSDLANSGIETWTDADLLPGQRWRSAIRKAIRDGVAFLACFSPEAVSRNRTYMHEEITVAIEALREMPTDRAWFIPVLLAPCEIPERDIGGGETLRDIQWVELHADWSSGVGNIVRSLRNTLTFYEIKSDSSDEPQLPPLRAAPPPEILDAWKAVWRALFALKASSDQLIKKLDDWTLLEYVERLHDAVNAVGETAFFFEKDDFKQLNLLLHHSLNFRIGKKRLLELRRSYQLPYDPEYIRHYLKLNLV